MSIIGTGFGLRRRAQEGMSAVAKLEAQENQQRMGLDQARQAQKMQMYGSFAVSAHQSGLQKLLLHITLQNPQEQKLLRHLQPSKQATTRLFSKGYKLKLTM